MIPWVTAISMAYVLVAMIFVLLSVLSGYTIRPRTLLITVVSIYLALGVAYFHAPS